MRGVPAELVIGYASCRATNSGISGGKISAEPPPRARFVLPTFQNRPQYCGAGSLLWGPVHGTIGPAISAAGGLGKPLALLLGQTARNGNGENRAAEEEEEDVFIRSEPPLEAAASVEERGLGGGPRDNRSQSVDVAGPTSSSSLRSSCGAGEGSSS